MSTGAYKANRKGMETSEEEYIIFEQYKKFLSYVKQFHYDKSLWFREDILDSFLCEEMDMKK